MITEAMLHAAGRGEKAALIALPKTDLHSHSALACDPSLYERLIGSDFSVPSDFGSLSRFLAWVGTTFDILLQHRDLALLTLESACSVMKRDGVTHAEISLHLPLAHLRGTNWFELAPGLDQIRNASGIDLAFELGIPRPVSDELLNRDAVEALETGIFAGIDIYDDELHCSLERFRPIIAAARKLGYYVKIHSGEVGDPERIWEDIRLAEPDAIQHGVRASEDPELVRFLVKNRIPLHICPTSNVKLGVSRSLREHPIRDLFDAGVIVTVNTDDYAAFGSSVSDELLALHSDGVFSATELEQIRQNGFEARQRR